MKTREQIRNNRRTEIERFGWIQTRVAFVSLSERWVEIGSCPRAFWKSTDTSLWRHTATRLANRTMHWLIKQITNTYRNHFSGSYENRSYVAFLKTPGQQLVEVGGEPFDFKGGGGWLEDLLEARVFFFPFLFKLFLFLGGYTIFFVKIFQPPPPAPKVMKNKKDNGCWHIKFCKCWSYFVKINSAKHQHDTEWTQNGAGL